MSVNVIEWHQKPKDTGNVHQRVTNTRQSFSVQCSSSFFLSFSLRAKKLRYRWHPIESNRRLWWCDIEKRKLRRSGSREKVGIVVVSWTNDFISEKKNEKIRSGAHLAVRETAGLALSRARASAWSECVSSSGPRWCQGAPALSPTVPTSAPKRADSVAGLWVADVSSEKNNCRRWCCRCRCRPVLIVFFSFHGRLGEFKMFFVFNQKHPVSMELKIC